MKCTILHESRGRIRVHVHQSHMSLEQADVLECYLQTIAGVKQVKVYDRTCDVLVSYYTERSIIISALASFSYATSIAPEHSGRQLSREYEDKLTSLMMKHVIKKFLLPAPIRAALTVIQASSYIKRGLSALFRGKIDVAVLDAVSIGVSVVRQDYSTAGSVMLLLGIGELLEEWTHKKSVDDLARTMALNVDKVWMKVGREEVLVPVKDVPVGGTIVIRTSGMIPLDGRVVAGTAMVNQSSITGESMPVCKEIGSYAYAGTVVEEGECLIQVEKQIGSGHYDRIVKMIEASEKLKSDTENKASNLADGLVPYSLCGTALVYALTRNITKALSILMVDFSCALKLAMPIAVLSAMRECGEHQISVKGGRFMESVSNVSTIVFDKTGTLTHAKPSVRKIITFGHNDSVEMLRLAACLEEHYPHSMAKAVVEEAMLENLSHDERHSKVEYVVAHGISSMVDGEKVLIGSYHFIFQDEGCIIPEGEEIRFKELPEEYSHLFMAISGKLAAVICIEDPLRDEAAEIMQLLRKSGVKKLVMMTGDSERTAAVVANRVGVDEYYSEVLPEDKAAYIQRERDCGGTVMMIGDGVNDSPALSAANVGIAISDGAPIAREVADITISADDLYTLVTLKHISDLLMQRIRQNYRLIIGFNLSLIGFGVAGFLAPATSALLHNMSTLAISLRSMTPLLDRDQTISQIVSE